MQEPTFRRSLSSLCSSERNRAASAAFPAMSFNFIEKHSVKPRKNKIFSSCDGLRVVAGVKYFLPLGAGIFSRGQ